MANATNHTNKVAPMCTIDMKELGLAGVHLTDTGAGDLVLKGAVLNIHMTKTKASRTLLLCPEATTGTASWQIDATVTGFNGAAGATLISLSHPQDGE